MKPVLEFEDYRELVELGILVLGAVCDQLFDLSELKPHHVEQVDRRLVQKSAGNIYIAGPDRIFELAPVHLDVSRVRFVTLEQMAQVSVDRSEPSIVPDLKDTFAFVGRVTELGG